MERGRIVQRKIYEKIRGGDTVVRKERRKEGKAKGKRK